jgi:DNA-binding CsgD family transcriptional regulator
MLNAIEPFVRAYVEMQASWQAEVGTEPGFRERFDLRERIRTMRSGLLTPREIDTIELMLKGHSTKSMARVLGIDDGTVANHKRNIYAKLEVHSQAQLFDLFLRSLTEGDG